MRIVIDNYKAKPKERPRFGKKGKVYSPSGAGEEALAWEIKAYASHNYPKHKPIENNITIDLMIALQDEPRGDIDNYEKFIYDSLQKSGIIANDKQIRENHTKIVKGSNKIIIEILKYDPLTKEQKRIIAKKMRQQGYSIRQVAKKLNVSFRFARG